MTYGCFACEKLSTVANCVKTIVVDGTSSDVQVSKYVSSVTGSFTQNTANTTATTLKITNFKYEPNSKTAIGRFYFKPSTTETIYATS